MRTSRRRPARELAEGCLGRHDPDFRAYGIPFDHRVSRFDEALVIITTLLRMSCAGRASGALTA